MKNFKINTKLNENKKERKRDGSNKSTYVVPDVFHNVPPIIFIINIIIQNNTNCNKKRQIIAFVFQKQF